MTTSADGQKRKAGARLHSLDVLRGLVILVMMFVNDIAGVRGTPGWMKHVSPPSADGMTFVDVVFPAFLFIAGMALPLAFERRMARGDSRRSILSHTLIRTFSLLVMGVLMVNTENASRDGLLDVRLWNLLMYAGICMIWIFPSSSNRKNVRWRRTAGVLLLALLAVLFRGQGEPGLIELRPHWWGILGLIGWAYLVTAVLYLVLRQNPLGFSAAVVLLYCVYFADTVGFFNALRGFSRWVSIGSMLGSHAAITASGALLGLTLVSTDRSHVSRIRFSLLYAGVLAGAAVLLHSLHDIHRMFYYNKIAATPPWCLLSSAWTVLVWVVLYWLVEMKGLLKGTRIIAWAGQNALFAFILGPIAYSLFALLPVILSGFDPWGWLGSNFPSGLIRSLLFAAAAVCFTAFLRRRGYPLRV